MKESKVIIYLMGIIVVFIVGVVLKLAKPVLFPFFLALFLSFIVSPGLDFLIRLKIPKTVAIIFILLVTFFLLYLLGIIFYSSGKAFVAEVPHYLKKIDVFLKSLQVEFQSKGWKWDPLATLESFNIEKMASFLLSSLGTFFSFFSNLFLIFIFLLFILAGKGKVMLKIENYLSQERASEVTAVLNNINDQVQRYLAIKTMISFISAVLATIILFLFGVDFALVFGFTIFILNYIPNIGSIIGFSLPVILSLFQFESFWRSSWLLIILIAMDALVANFLEPRLMGRGLGLSPLFVLFSLFFWGWLWGIPGMILAVPIAAILKIVCSNIPSLSFLGILMSK